MLFETDPAPRRTPWIALAAAALLGLLAAALVVRRRRAALPRVPEPQPAPLRFRHARAVRG